jgi:hypothetical protein
MKAFAADPEIDFTATSTKILDGLQNHLRSSFNPNAILWAPSDRKKPTGQCFT